MQGDSPSRWSEEPFQMFEGGPWWVPPELPLIDLVSSYYQVKVARFILTFILCVGYR